MLYLLFGDGDIDDEVISDGGKYDWVYWAEIAYYLPLCLIFLLFEESFINWRIDYGWLILTSFSLVTMSPLLFYLISPVTPLLEFLSVFLAVIFGILRVLRFF